MASHVRSFSYLRWSISRFESTMRTFKLRQTKIDEFIQGRTQTTPFRKQLHFTVSLQWISLHAIFGKKTLLFWSDILPFSLVFLKWFDDRSFWWNGNSHKTPFGNTKKENGLQCIAPLLKLELYTFAFTFKNKNKENFSSKKPKLSSSSAWTNSPYSNRKWTRLTRKKNKIIYPHRYGHKSKKLFFEPFFMNICQKK